MKQQEKWCRLHVSGNTYIVPMADAIRAFEIFNGAEIERYVTFNDGSNGKVIVPAFGYASEVTIAVMPDFDRIAERALGETYIKENN